MSFEINEFDESLRAGLSGTLSGSARLFSVFDRDGDERLSDEEIDSALEREWTSRRELEFVALMRSSADKIRHLVDEHRGDGRNHLTYLDIAELSACIDSSPDSLSPARAASIDSVLEDYKQITDRAALLTNTRIGSPRDVAEKVSPDAVVQGRIGDCHVLAAVASLAATDPDALAGMIFANEDGTFGVRFPGAREIAVTAPTRAELACYACGPEGEIWPAIMEKALDVLFSSQSAGGEGTGLRSLERGGDPGRVLSALTGRPTVRYFPGVESIADVRDLLEKARSERLPLVATTEPFFSAVRNGIVDNHAYSVLDYDPSTQTVKLRNPWGRVEPGGDKPRDGKDDGVFWLSIEEFQKKFFSLYVPDDRRLKLKPPAPPPLG